MKTKLLLLLLFALTHAFSQTQVKFQKAYGTLSCEDNFGGKETHDGYILAGHTGIPPYIVPISGYLLKTDFQGELSWAKTYAASQTVTFIRALETPDSGYIAAGVWGLSPDRDVLLMKTDSIGNIIWSQKYGGVGDDYGLDILITTDSGYLIIGRTSSYGAGSGDVYLLKTDASGNLLWTRTYGGSGLDIPSNIRQTSDGGYIISCATHSFGVTQNQVYRIKTDANGNLEWSKIYGGRSWGDHTEDAMEAPGGGYFMFGNTQAGPSSVGNFWLIKTNSAGDALWSKAYGRPGSDQMIFYNADTVPGGKLIMTGTVQDNPGVYYGYLLETDSMGNLLFKFTFPSTQIFNDVHYTTDGGFMLSSTSTASFASGCNDFHLVKTDSAGNSGCYQVPEVLSTTSPPIIYTANTTIVDSGGTASSVLLIPTAANPQELIFCTSVPNSVSEINKNDGIKTFPNPSDGSFSISSGKIIRNGFVEICNSFGETVFKNNISNESKKEINLKNIPCGIYFLKVFDGEKYFSEKVIIVQN